MKRINRIISSVVLMCFLFNTLLSDLAFGQSLYNNNSYKLAQQTASTNIQDPQTIDLKFINIWFTALVYYMKNRELEITPETIQNIANTPKDQRGAKLFQLKDTRFFTHEIPPAVDSIITMRVKRGKPGEKPRYYIAEYSIQDGILKIYPEPKDGKKIARRASAAKVGDQGENPAAATRQDAPLSYLLHHPLLNSLIGMALTPLSDETMKVERMEESLGNGTFKQIYFLGNEDDVSFLDIFNRLALLRADKNHRTKANASDEMAIVIEMLNIAHLNAPNGSLNDKFVETVKAQLALQIDHFGVENTDSIYTLKRYYKHKDEIVAHAELERRIHNKCIEKLGSTKYRDWRQSPGTKEEAVEISGISEAHPGLRGRYTYNSFAQAAHNIAEAEHPLTHIAPPLGPEKLYDNIVAGNQSPVAGTRVSEAETKPQEEQAAAVKPAIETKSADMVSPEFERELKKVEPFLRLLAKEFIKGMSEGHFNVSMSNAITRQEAGITCESVYILVTDPNRPDKEFRITCGSEYMRSYHILAFAASVGNERLHSAMSDNITNSGAERILKWIREQVDAVKSRLSEEGWDVSQSSAIKETLKPQGHRPHRGDRRGAALKAGLVGIVMSGVVAIGGALTIAYKYELSEYFYIIPAVLAGVLAAKIFDTLLEKGVYRHIRNVRTFNPSEQAKLLMTSLEEEDIAKINSITEDWTFEEYILAVDALKKMPAEWTSIDIDTPAYLAALNGVNKVCDYTIDCLLARLRENKVQRMEKGQLNAIDILKMAVKYDVKLKIGQKGVSLNEILGSAKTNESEPGIENRRRDALELWSYLINYPTVGQEEYTKRKTRWDINFDTDQYSNDLKHYLIDLLFNIGRQSEAYKNMVEVKSLAEAVSEDINSTPDLMRSERVKNRTLRLWNDFTRQLGIKEGTLVNAISVEMALLAIERDRSVRVWSDMRVVGSVVIPFGILLVAINRNLLWPVSVALGAAGLARIAMSAWRSRDTSIIARLSWHVEDARIDLMSKAKEKAGNSMFGLTSGAGRSLDEEPIAKAQVQPPVEPVMSPTADELFGDRGDWRSEELVLDHTPRIVDSSSAEHLSEQKAAETPVTAQVEPVAKQIESGEVQTVPAGVFAANIPSKETDGIDNIIELGKSIRDASDGKYRLIVPDEFFSGQEFGDCKDSFGDRFILGRVSGFANISSTNPGSLDDYIDRVIEQVKEKDMAIALVPKGITPEQRARLTEKGIRFIPVTDNIMQIRSLPPGLRSDIRFNTFAMMYAMRHIKNTDEPGTPVYEMVKRYIKNRLVLVGTTPDAYINALVNDIADIIVYAWLKPIEKYNADTEKIEHDTKSFPLVFA